MTTAATAAATYKQWELENKVKPTSNAYAKWDPVVYKNFLKAKPWRADTKYFKKVYISSLALLKVLAHAKSGQGKAGVISQDKSNWVEVMGMLQGYAFEETIVITDAFALPVEGKEVEARLDERSEAYLVNYTDVSGKMRPEGCVGWYHSHPGLHSFMSSTDCKTQRDTQPFNDPWCALVVDPVKSLVTGTVDFGIYRTWPEGQFRDEEFDMSGVPLSKIKEYGSSFREYYQLEVTVYRSETDAKLLELLWSQYCIAALSGSPLLTNRHFIDGRLEKNAHLLDEASDKLVRSRAQAQGAGGGAAMRARSAGSKKKDEAHPLEALTRATGGTANEVLQGLLGMMVKESVFNVHQGAPATTSGP